MRLTDLDPRFVDAGGPGIFKKNGDPVPERTGVGVSFDCPCGCGTRGYVDFTNPLDGGPQHNDGPSWRRDGSDFDAMTLSPSILRSRRKGGCGWHGWIRAGEIVEA